MKKTIFLFALMLHAVAFSQTNGSNSEQFPVFSNCDGLYGSELENCFYSQLQTFIIDNFKVPDNLQSSNYKGNVNVLFAVDTAGVFKVMYVDAIYAELGDETRRVFGMLPKVKPSTYSGKPVFSKYTYRIAIPLGSVVSVTVSGQTGTVDIMERELTELDSVGTAAFDHPIYRSKLYIPFTHRTYSRFDRDMNMVGSNNHTASKPYTYAEVSKYYDLEAEYRSLLKPVAGWWGRKLWNENLVQIQGRDYWFTMNPILDVRLGKSSPSASSYTYMNTRGLQVQGGLGKDLVFTTTIYESQGRFADYYNSYANSMAPDGGNPAIIPGIGIAKDFKTDSYDFPSADANLTYSPGDFINLQLGYGRNFLGDGYRSLLTSDGASPYPYVKVNTNFWKIKYTNTYMWLKDVRPDVTEERTFATKFMANHYLSWNVNKRWNVGFFESVIWTNTNDRGFDMNFVNPIVFYRTVEFASSARTGNAVLGITSKYKWSNSINFYGQFILDEFSLSDVKAQNNSWKNKYGFQIGAKYFDALGIDNLILQAEFNTVRPYVYSHSEPITNYGHNNQSMGHQWGGNLRELIGIARYQKGRYYADAKITLGIRGLDYNTEENSLNYGSDIYRDYDIDRPGDTGIKIGQGNKTTLFIADFQAGYLINPATNLNVFGSLIYRSFNPATEAVNAISGNTTWFSVGIRADLFNWYFDY
jgi:hypothetical protein